MKRTAGWILTLLLPVFSTAQDLSLEQALQEAVAHYPQTKRKALIDQTAALTVENLRRQYLPQLNLSAQATYQSEVTTVKIPLPGVSITPPSKDQYKVLADLNQLVYDGGAVKQQQTVQQLAAATEQQQLEVEYYKLKERVTQIYMGVLYLDEQLKTVALIESDINTGIRKTEAQVQNGTAFRSQVLLLKAELLKAGQRRTELGETRKGWVEVLSLFTGLTLMPTTKLQLPVMSTVSEQALQRPELQLFQAQQVLTQQQLELLKSRNRPKASIFLQGGYGRPGLNFLNNDFSFFYIGGLRLNWALSSFYTSKRDRMVIENNRKQIDAQQETFLLNTRSQLVQQTAEIRKLEKLLAADEEILSLRSQVSAAVKAQLDNGVITAADYLREINAEDQARQTLAAHRIQLLQARINYSVTSGKF